MDLWFPQQEAIRDWVVCLIHGAQVWVGFFILRIAFSRSLGKHSSDMKHPAKKKDISLGKAQPTP